MTAFVSFKYQTTDESVEILNLNVDEIPKDNEQNLTTTEASVDESTTNAEISSNENQIESEQLKDETNTHIENNLQETSLQSDQTSILEEPVQPVITTNDNKHEIINSTTVCGSVKIYLEILSFTRLYRDSFIRKMNLYDRLK